MQLLNSGHMVCMLLLYKHKLLQTKPRLSMYILLQLILPSDCCFAAAATDAAAAGEGRLPTGSVDSSKLVWPVASLWACASFTFRNNELQSLHFRDTAMWHRYSSRARRVQPRTYGRL
jgi:hypothetical protein